MSRSSKSTGFSLLELLVVIVLLGILASGAGLLITKPIEAYEAQVRRQQLVDQGEMALRQIARDVRRALPNSIRLTSVGAGEAVEMVPIVDGARYRDEVGGEFVAPNDILEFGGADSDFNLLGYLNEFNAPPNTTLTGLRMVIYNTDATPALGIYADAAANNNPGIVTPSGTTLTLSENAPPTEDPEHHINIAPAFQFSQQSPGQRVFVVDDPISYVCDPNTSRIMRFSGYGFFANQPSAPGGNSDPVISQLSSCNISYTAGTSQRGGILSFEIGIADSSGEAINLLHQVHVMNLP